MAAEVYQNLADQLAQQGVNVNKIASFLGTNLKTAIIITAMSFSIIMIWSLVWKGLALWKAAHKNHKVFFILILIINTLGIFEILYIYVFSKMNIFNKENNKPKTRNKPKSKIKTSKKKK